MTRYKFKLEYALLHLNYNCNLNCTHCRVPIKDKHKESMSFELAKNIIDQLSDANVPIVTFTGGEPTIYHDTLELISYTVNKGINVRLQTNFTKIDSQFLEEFYSLGGRLISLSLDGLEKTHDEIRGQKGLFSKIISLITKYNHVISFQVDFVLSKYNYPDLYQLLNLLRSIGVKIFSFRTMVPVADAVVQDHYLFTNQELFNVYKEIFLKTNDLSDIKIISPDPLYNLIKFNEKANYNNDNLIYLSGCSIGLGILSIQPNADVLLCSFINKPIGNLHNEKLKSIIKRISKIEIVNNLILRKGIKICSECEFKFLCGGCRARAVEILGDFYETDPLCFKAFLNT